MMDLEALKRNAFLNRHGNTPRCADYSEGFDDAVRELREQLEALRQEARERHKRCKGDNVSDFLLGDWRGLDFAIKSIFGEAPPVVSPTEERTCENDGGNCTYSRTDCAADGTFNCRTHPEGMEGDEVSPPSTGLSSSV